ncbi:MAG: hypothetical protein RIQ89_499 [Bacteroidota bacterium]|jgi:hypothetical protein
MIDKIFIRNMRLVLLFLSIAWLSCNPASQEPKDLKPISLATLRFENLLFENPNYTALVASDENFTRLFLYGITSLGSTDTALASQRMLALVNDSNFRNVYSTIQFLFTDFNPYQSALENAFAYYHYYLPSQPLPKIVTTMSVFSYPIICDSLHLAIALDMYLGENSQVYNTLQPPLPVYIRKNMRPEYIVSDAMKGWLQSDFYKPEDAINLLEKSIQQGKIIFALKKILPDLHDSLITGYTADQVKWCYENEAKIWSFFLEQKLLFSNDAQQLMKYTDEGPTTNGFPPQAPGMISQFIGYRIVAAFMEKNEMPLNVLMDLNDANQILQKSKYKPTNNS